MKPTSISLLRIMNDSQSGRWLTLLPLLLLLGGVVLPANVFAAPPNPSPVTITVNCPGGSINTTLASLDPSADNTIQVSGACTENVDIESFDRLTLVALGVASISDASGGATAVLSINDSTRVTVQGFTINGNGPSGQSELIDCTASSCTFRGNTVQGGGSDGVDVFNGARAFFINDVFQDLGTGGLFGPTGIFVGGNSLASVRGVTIQRVTGDGVQVSGGAFLVVRDSVVQHNAGSGIFLNLDGTANIRHSTITGNTGDGIDVTGHSTISLGAVGAAADASSITGNRGVGILVKDLSFARFPQGVPNVVKNNLGRKDVLCSPQFPATRGVHTSIGGGKTNCDEDDER